MFDVTKKEFQEISNHYWKRVFDAGETMTDSELKQFKSDEYTKLKQYRIVLPEKVEHTNEKIIQLIEEYCTDLAIKNKDCKIYSGVAGTITDGEIIDDCYRPTISHSLLSYLGFSYKHEWSDAFREVYISKQEKVILTICEGDLFISVHQTQDDFEREIKEASDFYLKYA